MSGQLYYLVNEDIFNQVQTARQLVGLCHSLMGGAIQGTTITMRSDEMAALLDCLEQSLEPIERCVFRRVEDIPT
ncbi:MAG: hypothetical protein ACK4GU_16280 [Alishewanella aestuarii]